MKFLFLLPLLFLAGCNKPDPIEACVEAERKSTILECENLYRKEGGKCPPEELKAIVTIREPYWRRSCMRAAAGKED